MKNTKLYNAQILILLIALTVGCSDSVTEPKQEKQLHSVIKGSGDKSIVFESGLGDGYNSWDPIINDVSGFAQTVTYNRAGYDPSPEMAEDRSLDNAVEELRELLDQKGIKAPHILVGHSYGGLIMYYFARKYPAEVSGLVLLDSTPHQFYNRMKAAEISEELYYPTEEALTGMHPIMKSEFESIKNAEERVNTRQPLADIPLIVLTSSKSNPGYPQEFTDLWVTLHNEIALESTQGIHIVSDEVGHYIHHEASSEVVEILQSLVQ